MWSMISRYLLFLSWKAVTPQLFGYSCRQFSHAGGNHRHRRQFNHHGCFSQWAWLRLQMLSESLSLLEMHWSLYFQQFLQIILVGMSGKGWMTESRFSCRLDLPLGFFRYLISFMSNWSQSPGQWIILWFLCSECDIAAAVHSCSVFWKLAVCQIQIQCRTDSVYKLGLLGLRLHVCSGNGWGSHLGSQCFTHILLLLGNLWKSVEEHVFMATLI